MQKLNSKFSRIDKFAILVFILSLLLRIDSTFSLPSLNWDEVSHGYNAYSILNTGKDEWGVSWPAIFKAYGDYKLPVYIYLTAISEFLFGLNTLSVRLVSILSGGLIVLFTYLLAKKLFNSHIGLISAAIVGLAPWSYFLSLGAFEANLAQLFVIAGLYFFISGGFSWKLPLSVFLFGLSVWTYNSERVFVPLLLVALIWLSFGNLTLKKLLNTSAIRLSLVILSAFFIPMFYQLLFAGEGSARYRNVAILDQGAINQIEIQRSSSEHGPALSRLVYNKITFFGSELVKNYVSHFSPEFLLFKGGNNYQFNIQNKGLLYLIDSLPILVGILYLIKTRNSFASKLLLIWLIIAPIPASLTREAPHTLRAISFLPLPMIISAVGLFQIWMWWQKRVSLKLINNLPITLYTFLLLYLTIGYITTLFYEYPKQYSQSWQYGYKETVSYIKKSYSNYDQIIFTKKYGEPHEFVLFYWPWEPENYRNDPKLVRYPQSNWFWVDSFDKFIFVNDWEIPKNENKGWKTEKDVEIDILKKTLLITSPGTYPSGWTKLETIYFLDESPAFEILEN